MPDHSVHHQLLAQRRFRQVAMVLFGVAILIGILMSLVEKGHPGSTINNVGDGLWWAFTTISTVGYGDTFPVTSLGRVLGVTLMGVGVVAYSILIGLIVHAVHRRQDDVYRKREFEYLDNLNQRMEKLERKIDFLVKDGHPTEPPSAH